jgi:hypothetical protein
VFSAWSYICFFFSLFLYSLHTFGGTWGGTRECGETHRRERACDAKSRLACTTAAPITRSLASCLGSSAAGTQRKKLPPHGLCGVVIKITAQLFDCRERISEFSRATYCLAIAPESNILCARLAGIGKQSSVWFSSSEIYIA